VTLLIVVQVTFAIDYRYTFPQGRADYTLYVLGQIKGFLVNFIVFEGCLTILPGYWSMKFTTAFIMGSEFALASNYIFAKSFAFAVRDRK